MSPGSTRSLFLCGGWASGSRCGGGGGVCASLWHCALQPPRTVTSPVYAAGHSPTGQTAAEQWHCYGLQTLGMSQHELPGLPSLAHHRSTVRCSRCPTASSQQLPTTAHLPSESHQYSMSARARVCVHVSLSGATQSSSHGSAGRVLVNSPAARR